MPPFLMNSSTARVASFGPARAGTSTTSAATAASSATGPTTTTAAAAEATAKTGGKHEHVKARREVPRLEIGVGDLRVFHVVRVEQPFGPSVVAETNSRRRTGDRGTGCTRGAFTRDPQLGGPRIELGRRNTGNDVPTPAIRARLEADASAGGKSARQQRE